MQRKNPYDTLRKIRAEAIPAAVPGSKFDCILKLANEVLQATTRPVPYATQDDVLDAIRGRCRQVPFGSPSSHLAAAVAELAELGLVLPAIELTPVQRVADQLLEVAQLVDTGKADHIDVVKLRELLEPLRPAQRGQPTLEEALEVLRQIVNPTTEDRPFQAARALLDRVPK